MASGNIVVENQGLNPLVSYNYMLRVEGVFDLPCKSVHSFTKENEYEFIQEGGLNDYVHMRRKSITKPFTFTVERYVGIDYYDPLQNGSELTLPVILLVTRHANRFDVTKRAYVFTGCTVMSKEYGELNAEQSGLLTETTVIGYREMLVVNAIDQGIGSWSFDGTHTDGRGPRFAQTYIMPEVEAQEGKNEPSLWEFDQKKVGGNGKQRAAKDISTPAGTPRLWNLDEKKPEGSGKRSAKTENAQKAQGRKWPTVSSAKKRETDQKESSSKKLLWEFDGKTAEGKGTRSARREESEAAEGRKWPPTVSARTYPVEEDDSLPGGEG